MKQLLKKLHACDKAIEWVGDKTIAEAWNTCDRPAWMIWLLVRQIDKKGWPTKKVVLKLIADCAQMSLRVFEQTHPNDKRLHEAIQAVRDYVDGKITETKLQEYKNSAYVAYAAYAAYYDDDAYDDDAYTAVCIAHAAVYTAADYYDAIAKDIYDAVCVTAKTVYASYTDKNIVSDMENIIRQKTKRYKIFRRDTCGIIT